ncbi:MAG TPA: PHP domain-containing protein [Gemmatimonadaceae bacterium]|nr:PHP domain-containing protein [Gemmatimonadaceae bacterium]
MTAGAHGPAQHVFVDLHMHSTASDGARTPTEVVEAAAGLGLAAIALTDHDTLDGLPAAREAAANRGLRIVTGVELSAVEGDVETHVLGLHLSDTVALEQRLHMLRDMRRNRAVSIVARLNALGVPLTLDDVLAQANGGAVGRPHVARALVARGFVPEFKQAFERYLGNGRAAYVAKDKLPLEEAVQLIHRAGGIAVLAHPGSLGTRERLAALAAVGLDGVEVLHPSHSWEDSQRLDQLASEFDLVRSGGSDWHGGTEGSRSLGMMRVPAHWLADQDRRVSTRAQRVA